MTETMRSRRKINMTRKERKHEMLLTDQKLDKRNNYEEERDKGGIIARRR
jgi:hypothetical protein